MTPSQPPETLNARVFLHTIHTYLDAQEFLPKGGVPHADVGHGAGDEEVGAIGREDDVVHPREVAGAPELRFHVHRDPVPFALGADTHVMIGGKAKKRQDTTRLLVFVLPKKA